MIRLLIVIIGAIPVLLMSWRLIEKKEEWWIFLIGFYFLVIFPFVVYQLDKLFPTLLNP